MKKRLVIILFFTALFVAFITIWDYSYKLGLESAYIPKKEVVGNLIPSERAVFTRASFALKYAHMTVDKGNQRSLKNYYNNRAYPGAPPSIPHHVNNDETVGGNDCLKCHQNGGFVNKFNAYAPVTPHPKMLNCRQCHVLKVTKKVLFQNTNFTKIAPPKVGKGVNNALLGSPPRIPHQIQMRENCLSCHAGLSAPKEIRVSHPERINCRQCHALREVNENSNQSLFKR